MQVALFADIHANLEALEAVLADAADQGCTHYLCLGDIVGYNANPAECLERVRSLDCPTVKGNHDQEASSDRSLDLMNPIAAEALNWTRQQLTDEQRKWLSEQRMVQQVEDLTAVHSSLDRPEAWNYITKQFDALAHFSYQLTPFCFHGHTHIPRVFVKDQDEVVELEAESFQAKEGLKYLINVGSVGQPRDGDSRACYTIYHSSKKTVTFRRLDYDLEATQQKILAAGLSETLANRLSEGR